MFLIPFSANQRFHGHSLVHNHTVAQHGTTPLRLYHQTSMLDLSSTVESASRRPCSSFSSSLCEFINLLQRAISPFLTFCTRPNGANCRFAEARLAGVRRRTDLSKATCFLSSSRTKSLSMKVWGRSAKVSLPVGQPRAKSRGGYGLQHSQCPVRRGGGVTSRIFNLSPPGGRGWGCFAGKRGDKVSIMQVISRPLVVGCTWGERGFLFRI